jgi:hypothetical protein
LEKAVEMVRQSSLTLPDRKLARTMASRTLRITAIIQALSLCKVVALAK